MNKSLWNRLGLGVLGFTVALLGLIFVVLLFRGYRMAKAYDSWGPVPCSILSSWVEEVPQPGSAPAWYRFRVRYRYEINGRRYVSERVSDLDKSTRKRSNAEALMARYPVGNRLVCYVNPERVGDAILKLPTKASGYSIWFPCLFVVGGIGMMVVSVRQRRANR